MSAPKPSDFQAVIPASNSSLCDKLVKALIRLPTLVYQLVVWMFNEDGTATDAFKASLGLSTDFPAPTGVTATDGTHATEVTVTWSSVIGALTYDVYRSASNDSSTATLVGPDVAVTSYVDTPTVNQTFFYWVKAKKSGELSAFSSSDSGYAGTVPASGGGGGLGTLMWSSFDSPASNEWTFPGVVPSTLRIKVWGGGGSGGGIAAFTTPVAGQPFGGGGGGSGACYELAAVAINPGEVLKVYVATGKSATGPNAGETGNSTSVTRQDGTPIVRADGGGGGGLGFQTSGGTAGAAGTTGDGTLVSAGNAGSAGAASSVGGAGGAALAPSINSGGTGATPYFAVSGKGYIEIYRE